MKRGKSDAETCAINGWTVGTILIGRPRPSTPAPVIRITAIGMEKILAEDADGREGAWTLIVREWRALDGPGFGSAPTPDPNQIVLFDELAPQELDA